MVRILTGIESKHLPIFTVSGRVVEPTPLASPAIVRVTPASVNSPEIGKEFLLTAEIVGGETSRTINSIGITMKRHLRMSQAIKAAIYLPKMLVMVMARSRQSHYE